MAAIILAVRQASAQATDVCIRTLLSVKILSGDGSYEVQTPGNTHVTLRARVSAKIEERWVTTDDPEHRISEIAFQSALGSGHQIAVSSSGLSNQPKPVYEAPAGVRSRGSCHRPRPAALGSNQERNCSMARIEYLQSVRLPERFEQRQMPAVGRIKRNVAAHEFVTPMSSRCDQFWAGMRTAANIATEGLSLTSLNACLKVSS